MGQHEIAIILMSHPGWWTTHEVAELSGYRVQVVQRSLRRLFDGGFVLCSEIYPCDLSLEDGRIRYRWRF